jgi:hypothetical protein
VVTKDPDREIQGRIALVFATFLEARTAMAVMRTLQARGLSLPRRDRHGDIGLFPTKERNATRAVSWRGAFARAP